MAADFIAPLLVAADSLSLSELETASRRLVEIRNSKAPLFRLPGELRNRIWQMALIEDIQDQITMSKEKAAEKRKEDEEKQKHRVQSTESDATYILTVSLVSLSHYVHFHSTYPRGQQNNVISIETGDTRAKQRLMSSPTFFNACRQMKKEVETILYGEIMVWEEYDRILQQWRTLQPYQMASLLQSRKHGLSQLKLHHGCCFEAQKSHFGVAGRNTLHTSDVV